MYLRCDGLIRDDFTFTFTFCGCCDLGVPRSDTRCEGVCPSVPSSDAWTLCTCLSSKYSTWNDSEHMEHLKGRL